MAIAPGLSTWRSLVTGLVLLIGAANVVIMKDRIFGSKSPVKKESTNYASSRHNESNQKLMDEYFHKAMNYLHEKIGK